MPPVSVYLMRRLLLSLIVLSLLSSCIPQRDYVYFYKKNKAKSTDSIQQDMQVIQVPDHILATGDVLEILITSDNSIDLNVMQKKEASGNEGSIYSIPASGMLTIPLIGRIKVIGMFEGQLNDTLINRLKNYYVNPFVRVSVIKFNISIMGEVQLPGMRQINGDHINLLEALASAGDLDDYAKRIDVKVLRELEGKIKIFTIDLASATVFKSEGYYLQSNDIVVVTPYKSKRVLAKTQQLAFLTSILNTILIIFTIIRTP